MMIILCQKGRIEMGRLETKVIALVRFSPYPDLTDEYCLILAIGLSVQLKRQHQSKK